MKGFFAKRDACQCDKFNDIHAEQNETDHVEQKEIETDDEQRTVETGLSNESKE